MKFRSDLLAPRTRARSLALGIALALLACTSQPRATAEEAPKQKVAESPAPVKKTMCW